MTLVIALPFNQILEAVVAYPAVQYSLDLILFLTINESWGGGNAGRRCKGNLTDLRRILHLSLAKGNPKRTL
jgi:hypothetical protein